MNNLKVFEFEGQKVRITVIDDEIWFVGKDVAEILGYSDAIKAIIVHVDEEDKRFELKTSDSQNEDLITTVLINESGLYSLVFKSKLPTAKKFKRWVTSEVLPSIRKTESYGIGSDLLQSAANLLENPDFAIQIFTALKKEQKKNEFLKAKIKEDLAEIKCYKSVFDIYRSSGFKDASNFLDIPECLFMDFLEEIGFIYRNDKNKPIVYKKYLDEGYFYIKTIKCLDGKYRDLTLVTPLGLGVIEKKYHDKMNSFGLTGYHFE